MPWSIAVAQNPALPASLRLTIAGPANTPILVWRISDQPGVQLRQRVRGLLDSGGGMLSVIDTEVPVEAHVTYAVEAGGKVQVVSDPPVYVPAPKSRYGTRVAIIRSIENPTLLWSTVTVADERPEHDVSAEVFPILGRADPIVVSDVLRLESGTLTLLAHDMAHADEIIEVLQPGAPVVYRTPCSGKTRDKILTVTGRVQNTLWKLSRSERIISVPYQQIAWPNERPLPPSAPPAWVYNDLKTQNVAPTYAQLRVARRSYFDLATDVLAP